FEVASTIGEYEDTPLPSRLPADLGASSSKNPRIPTLPTEDEEMFRGFDGGDDSVLHGNDPAVRLKQTRPARELPVPPPEPVAAPAPVAEAPVAEDRAPP